MQNKNLIDIEKFIEENNLYISSWMLDAKIFELFEIEKIKEVIKNNLSFINEHGLTVSDVEKYINIQTQFEKRTDSTKKVSPCDALEVWSNNNKIFYQNAHIEKCSYNNTGWTWCEHASSHYIDINCFSTSGGAWHELDIKELKHIGTKTKTIWTWGHTGATGNGGLYIQVKVNLFKLVLDRKFINYVVSRIYNSDYKYEVKTWNKIGACYRSGSECFRTKQGLKNFLKNRNLKIGKKLECNNFYHEIIGDFDYEQHMDKKSYIEEKGNLKEFPLLSNGEYTTAFYKNGKVHYCNPNVQNRTKLEYRYE